MSLSMTLEMGQENYWKKMDELISRMRERAALRGKPMRNTRPKTKEPDLPKKFALKGKQKYDTLDLELYLEVNGKTLADFIIWAEGEKYNNRI